MMFGGDYLPVKKPVSARAERRKYYSELVDVRVRELHLPEEEKTLKTETFTKIQNELLKRRLA